MRKFSWILALLVALTMVFVGCSDGGSKTPPPPPPPPVEGDLVIDDAAEIAALISPYNIYTNGATAPDADSVQQDGTKVSFVYTSSGNPDHYGFKIDFAEEAKVNTYVNMHVTYKLVAHVTGNAKIGHKFKGSAGGENDLTPYADFEKYFGTEIGKELTQTVPIKLLPNKALWFTHNRYQTSPSTQIPVEYTLEIIKIVFEGGEIINDPIDDFEINLHAPVAGHIAPETIESAQFTGDITWSPELAAEDRFKVSTAYTATIVLTAKLGFTLAGLTDEAEFEIESATTVTYKASTKTVTAVFPTTGAEAQADIENGDGDAALNATYTRTGTKVFSLADWIADKEALAPPLANDSGTGTIVNGGINVTRDTDWKGLAYSLTGIDVLAKRYKITAYGFILGDVEAAASSADDVKFQMGGANSPWPQVAVSEVIVGTDKPFKAAAEIEGDYLFNSIRINTTKGTNAFRISLLEVEDLGVRPPCACTGCALKDIVISEITEGTYCTCAPCDGCVVCKVIGKEPSPLPEENTTVAYVPPAGGEGFFYLDLNEFYQITAGIDGNAHGRPIVRSSASNVIFTFSQNSQLLGITLSEEQKNIMKTAATLKLEIAGSAAPDSSFRHGFGMDVGANWNHTNLVAGKFSEIISDRDIVKSGNWNGNLTHFILQQREAAVTDVTITSIKVTYSTSSKCCETCTGCTAGNCTTCTASGGVKCCDACTWVAPSCNFCGVLESTGCDCDILIGNLASPFQRAGTPIVAVVENGLGVKFGESWSGIDLKFAFQEDDVLTIKGNVFGSDTLGSAQLLLQVNTGGEWADQQIGTPNLGTEATITIDSATLAKITASGGTNVNGIRLRLNNAGSLTRFVIEELTVTRADSTVFDLADWIDEL